MADGTKDPSVLDGSGDGDGGSGGAPDLKKLMAEIESLKKDAATSKSEAEKAFASRDADRKKLRAFEEKHAAATTESLVQTGELKAAYESLGKEHGAAKTKLSDYEKYVNENTARIGAKIPKDVLDSIPTTLDSMARLTLVTTLATSYERINPAPGAVNPVTPAGAPPDPSTATTMAEARKIMNDMTDEQKQEWMKNNPLGG